MEIRRALLSMGESGMNYNLLAGKEIHTGYISNTGVASAQTNNKEIYFDPVECDYDGFIIIIKNPSATQNFWCTIAKYNSNDEFIQRLQIGTAINGDYAVANIKNTDLTNTASFIVSFRTFGNADIVLLRMSDCYDAFNKSGTKTIHYEQS